MKLVPTNYREWKPIEKLVAGCDIWVIKYDLWQKDSTFVTETTPGATKLTSIHGWYYDEKDALEVLAHFPRPNSYHIERVHRRMLIGR